MKKIIFLGVCAMLFAVIFTSCNSGKKSAAKAAKEYTEHLKNGKYDEFIEIVAFEPIEVDAPATAEQKAAYSNVLKSKVHPKIQEKGGIKDVKVASEKVMPDGKNAEVVVTNTYNNGDTEDIAYAMVLEDQVWKVKMGHDKEVWKTHLADGSREVFKLKEDDHREIFKEDIAGERDFVKAIEEGDREVLKEKVDGEKDVVKVIDKKDETVVKTKEDGDKEVTKIPKE